MRRWWEQKFQFFVGISAVKNPIACRMRTMENSKDKKQQQQTPIESFRMFVKMFVLHWITLDRRFFFYTRSELLFRFQLFCSVVFSSYVTSLVFICHWIRRNAAIDLNLSLPKNRLFIGRIHLLWYYTWNHVYFEN